MRLLVITQDLRVSGTSAGLGRRSFIAKLRKAYPDSIIDVHYLIHRDTEDRLDLLPVNSIKKHIVSTKIPKHIVFLNRFYWRLLHVSLNERFQQKQFAKIISKIDIYIYDHIFISSAGTRHETILATHHLPILKKANIIFHDPYPLAWYEGYNKEPSNLDLFRLKQVIEVAKQARTCSSTAQYMSHDLKCLYAYKKKFFTLPHQFDSSVFDASDTSRVLKKSKKVSISYHGALMFGRNAYNLLLAYQELLKEERTYNELTEVVLRVKGDGVEKLKQHFGTIKNIKILDPLNFSNSYNEQMNESEILVILENGPDYCNILVGKAPFIASCNKPVLCLSPRKSELRDLIVDERCIANMNDVNDIKEKLKNLIDNRLVSNEEFKPFGDYFSEEKFKQKLNQIIDA
ncbi:hypothetical protein VOI54_09945 [Tamlana sp. 2201CG12-4]|uniref:hypothetical protein n=1 Tax=Tamlana sp. 2201CG12-4 TaxID=3112582 RepID=UPI002DB5D2D6|nr:hypothetical protein [Tamlana sp. 2201CG12-4]MEC3907339.1 hypothetical protein [Tamlana sp. 2201CG12-4]